MTPSEIRRALEAGEISHEEAVMTFAGNRRPAPRPSQEADEDYLTRQSIEEKTRHWIGLVAFGLLGVADGAIEAIGYGVSEIFEDLAFASSRIIRRSQEGWERGKQV